MILKERNEERFHINSCLSFANMSIKKVHLLISYLNINECLKEFIKGL